MDNVTNLRAYATAFTLTLVKIVLCGNAPEIVHTRTECATNTQETARVGFITIARKTVLFTKLIVQTNAHHWTTARVIPLPAPVSARQTTRVPIVQEENARETQIISAASPMANATILLVCVYAIPITLVLSVK